MSTTVTKQEFDLVRNHVYGDAITASRIVAGALWLDQVDGPWWERIDLTTFAINEPGRCVLGQVVRGECSDPDSWRKPDYGTVAWDDEADYRWGMQRLTEQGRKYMIHSDVAKAMGFHLLNQEDAEWTHKMNRGWYALIAHRQGQQDTVHPDEDEVYEDEGIETEVG